MFIPPSIKYTHFTVNPARRSLASRAALAKESFNGLKPCTIENLKPFIAKKELHRALFAYN